MTDKPSPALSSLLTPDDPQPYRILNRDGLSPLVLICDHASNTVPKSLNQLGLETKQLGYHIAIDIGAAEVTRYISDHLDAPAILCNYSRLVIDCNRPPGDPTSISKTSDGISIPMNLNLSEKDEILRAEEIFWPYHHTISDVQAHLWRKGTAPLLFSVHSFTPALMSRYEERPWHVSILWKRDPRLAQPLMDYLRENTDYKVGDNVPYSGWQEAYSIDLHGSSAGLAYCAIEIRQDLIADEAGQKKWGQLLCDALKSIMQDPSIFSVQHY